MPTEPRPGAPATVNLGPGAIEAMFGEVPARLLWLLPIYGLIQPLTFQTDVLCATRPGPAETWGFSDWLNGLNEDSHDLIIEKIERMAKAAVWDLYCHEVEAPEDQSISGPLQWLGEDWSGTVPEGLAASFDTGMIHPEADLWIITLRCELDPTEGSNPVVSVTNANGDAMDVSVAHGLSSTFGTMLFVVNRFTRFRTLDGQAFATWPEDATSWRIIQGGSDGQWALSITSYSVTPPPPLAWPAAPELPAPYQFSDLVAAQLATMAGQWATDWTQHRTNTSILPGMVTDVRDQLDVRADEILAALAAAGLDTAGFEAGPAYIPVNESGSFEVLAGAVGFFVYIEESPGATVLGNSPEAWFDVGFVSQAWDGSVYYASEPIKHNPQIFHPLRPGVTEIYFDLLPRTRLSFNWLVPVST